MARFWYTVGTSMATKKPAKKTSGDEYGAKQITVLEGLEPVRKRPGMYIGSTGPEGLHHLVWEVLDNSIDEAMGGHAKKIRLSLLPGNRVSVEDDGRGIPVDTHPQYKVSALELVLTKLHAGGKFGEGGYKVSGGLHGVGVSVVNALSLFTKAEVFRDGKIWVQEYERGKPKFKVKTTGNTRKRGTVITFEPDAQIFQTRDFDLQIILDHVRQQAYLTKGVFISVEDLRKKDEPFSYAFYFEGGVASYVKHINHNKEKKHENEASCSYNDRNWHNRSYSWNLWRIYELLQHCKVSRFVNACNSIRCTGFSKKQTLGTFRNSCRSRNADRSMGLYRSTRREERISCL